ncbi:MAG: FAD-dependent oxidoreductase [Clostridiales bacterium]|nr:FAD-dependent oxidoreductase [Clostridiales bacterium]
MDKKKVAIIGGGPAGVSAALYTLRANIDTTILAHGESALNKAEKIDNYYGFPDGISGPDLYDNGINEATAIGAKVINEEVVGLNFGAKLEIKTTDNIYEADAVILAMGSQRKAPKIDGIKEFEGNGVSYCAVCDGFFYRGKTVAVLGDGEYAANERAELEPIAAEVIALDDLDVIERFSGDQKLKKVEFKDGSTQEIDGLFVAIGTAGAGDLAKKVGIFTDENNKIMVDENMATNIPGIYAAGDCTGGFLQVSKAVADGAMAANSVIKYLRTK